MKKAIISIGVAASVLPSVAETAIIDFGETPSEAAINVTLDGSHGTITRGNDNWIIGVNGTATFLGQDVTWSLTTVNKNHNGGFQTTDSNSQWNKPFDSELLGSFAGETNMNDAIHMQTWGTDAAYMVLTLEGLQAGKYTMEVFGAFTGEGGISNVTLTNSGTASMDFNNWITMGTENSDSQQWVSMGSCTQTSATVNVGAEGPSSESGVSKNSGYYLKSGDGAITVGEDGTFSFTITATQKTGSEISWRALTLGGVALTKSVPEPATATLSLLALAGLAARRRRK